MNDELISGLRAAVEADLDNLALRVHLAELLFEASRTSEALSHLSFVLERRPDHAGAHRLLGNLGGFSPADISPERRRPHPEPTERELRRSERIPLDSGDDDHDTSDAVGEVDTVSVTMADVAGMEHVKRQLHLAFLAPASNPELREAFAMSGSGGLMLWGPPGCGKTFIAKALAGQLGAKFLHMGLADVLDSYFAETEQRIHQWFELARDNRPCVLFLDEFDALGVKRALLRHHYGRTIVNTLLQELDGLDSNNEQVFVLAATNHPWDVDPALRRPGRLDRSVLVLLPDLEARSAILATHLSGRPLGDVDLPGLAGRMRHFSGADIAHVCETATSFALERSLHEGEIRPITQRDLENALAEVQPSTAEWFRQAEQYAIYANEGGMYDELLAYMKREGLP